MERRYFVDIGQTYPSEIAIPNKEPFGRIKYEIRKPFFGVRRVDRGSRDLSDGQRAEGGPMKT